MPFSPPYAHCQLDRVIRTLPRIPRREPDFIGSRVNIMQFQLIANSQLNLADSFRVVNRQQSIHLYSAYCGAHYSPDASASSRGPMPNSNLRQRRSELRNSGFRTCTALAVRTDLRVL